MKKILCALLFLCLFNHKSFCEDITDEGLKNILFGYSSTVWKFRVEKYGYYMLVFRREGDKDVIYFYRIKDFREMEIAREGTFEIENSIVKINFTKVMYEDQLDEDRLESSFAEEFDNAIEEHLMIELEIEVSRTDKMEEYGDKIIVKQIHGKNIFEGQHENAQLEFTAWRNRVEV